MFFSASVSVLFLPLSRSPRHEAKTVEGFRALSLCGLGDDSELS